MLLHNLSKRSRYRSFVSRLVPSPFLPDPLVMNAYGVCTRVQKPRDSFVTILYSIWTLASLVFVPSYDVVTPTPICPWPLLFPDSLTPPLSFPSLHSPCPHIVIAFASLVGSPTSSRLHPLCSHSALMIDLGHSANSPTNDHSAYIYCPILAGVLANLAIQARRMRLQLLKKLSAYRMTTFTHHQWNPGSESKSPTNPYNLANHTSYSGLLYFHHVADKWKETVPRPWPSLVRIYCLYSFPPLIARLNAPSCVAHCAVFARLPFENIEADARRLSRAGCHEESRMSSPGMSEMKLKPQCMLRQFGFEGPSVSSQPSLPPPLAHPITSSLVCGIFTPLTSSVGRSALADSG
ncbi:hypothetical protein ACRALDRAFT_207917 [Sodiomyces alcalophilus JCM 7366]|uniref:uncharacterized protein n=1 Tax=Sodiomyces alcalophilus JCM 7366 TaxID=591952 RepID=UPI0039B534BC